LRASSASICLMEARASSRIFLEVLAIDSPLIVGA
jgi:hypothetical protein